MWNNISFAEILQTRFSKFYPPPLQLPSRGLVPATLLTEPNFPNIFTITIVIQMFALLVAAEERIAIVRLTSHFNLIARGFLCRRNPEESP